MDEAKSIVMMIVSVIIASSVLAASALLISYSNETWAVMQRQQTNNAAMHDYAKYAAYDNTEVKGSDIISFINETRGYPFTMVIPLTVDPPSSGFVANTTDNNAWTLQYAKPIIFRNRDYFEGRVLNTTAGDVCPSLTTAIYSNRGTSFYINPVTRKAYNLPDGKGDTYAAPDQAKLTTLLNKVTANGGESLDGGVTKGKTYNVDQNKRITVQQMNNLQTYFTNRGLAQVLGVIVNDDGSTTVPTEPGAPYEGYTRYKSVLVYEGDNTNEIVGVIFLEMQGVAVEN